MFLPANQLTTNTFPAWWENSTRVVLRRPQNKSSTYETKNWQNNLEFRIVVVSSVGMACEVLVVFFKFNWSFNLWRDGFWNTDIIKDWHYKPVRCIMWIGKCWAKWTITVFFWKSVSKFIPLLKFCISFNWHFRFTDWKSLWLDWLRMFSCKHISF